MKILILKDNYNSFEQFYIERLKPFCSNVCCYYKNNTIIRKIWTHFGIPFSHIWYEDWKNKLEFYDIIIIFDSIHNSKLIKYIRKHTNSRIIFWHWNPIKKNKDIKILNETRKICEHWTFNPIDANKYNIYLNNQFFFYFENIPKIKENKVFFVGTDKGRYEQLILLSKSIEKYNLKPDFFVIDKRKNGRFYKKQYMNYNETLEHISKSKYVLELVQDGQDGLTARALEAMFLETKFITNNNNIKKCEFYKKENIYVIGDENFEQFLDTPFKKIEKNKLYKYSAQGWIEKFMEV